MAGWIHINRIQHAMNTKYSMAISRPSHVLNVAYSIMDLFECENRNISLT